MEFRALKESELELWFDHLGAVFETTGRLYFVRHWNNDPCASLNDIFVAYDTQTNRIASTVKVFRREFYFNGNIYKTGGIGEVSTKPEYRSQGLAKKLLEMSVQHMKDNGIPVSTLSASKARPYYEKLGWKVVPELVTSQTLNVQTLLKRFNNGSSIQPVDLSSPTLIPQLTHLHHLYSQHFNGPLRRSDPKFWQGWVKAETGDNAYVMFDTENNSEGRTVVGFACIGNLTEDRLAVKDFFVNEEKWKEDRGRSILRSFVEFVVHHKLASREKDLELWYPSAMFSSGGGGAGLYEEVPTSTFKWESFLYRVVDDQFPLDTAGFVDQMNGDDNSPKHVFWDVDKF